MTNGYPVRVADLYTRWTLDGLIELARAVSLDVFARPQLYRSDVPDGVVALRMSYGFAPGFPDSAQRRALTVPILGSPDGLGPDTSGAPGSFQVARAKLFDACIAFSERAVDTGVAMLEDRVRSALTPFKAAFSGLEGRAFDLAAQQVGSEFDLATELLRAKGVATVFGVSEIDPVWPLGAEDPNGAKLVEAAATALSLSAEYRLGYTKFLLLQRVAREGAAALPIVLGAADDLRMLISRVYTWATSIRDFQQAP
jgi:hypothetical protein